MTNQNTAALSAFSATEREQQRITHLVLGAPRPRRKVTAKRKKTKAPIVRKRGLRAALPVWP